MKMLLYLILAILLLGFFLIASSPNVTTFIDRCSVQELCGKLN